MRTLWYVVSLFFITIYHAGRVVLASLVGVERRPDGIYDQAGRYFGKHLLAANGLSVETRGMEKIPDGPCVFVANHVSFVDIWVLMATLPGTVRFLAKKELMSVPLFGWAMKAAGHIPVHRQNRSAAVGAFDEASEMIRGGTSAIVFGEGTRSRDGTLRSLKKGPFVLAIKAEVPVVPIFLHGTFEVLPKGSVTPRPHPITMLVGDPILTTGLTYEDRERLGDRCRDALLALRTRVDAAGVPG